MYATASGADTGVPKSVAREFIASDKPGKLPSHVSRADGGATSESPFVERDAFTYLAPRDPKDKFAQCATCRLFMPTRSHCAALDRSVSAAASCDFYLHGEPTDDQIAKRSATDSEAGLVRRQVRCENCRFFASGSRCGLFRDLNEKFPDVFRLDENVDPKGCCDAQKPLREKRAEGGGIGRERRDIGGGFGSLGAENPWWARSEARRIYDVPFGGGFVNSSGAGRTDQIPMAVPADSHVITADVMSGLGQGNGLHGARVLNEALRVGPYGTPLPAHVRGPGPPRPPAISQRELSGSGLGMAEGGAADDRKVPALVAGGEYVIPCDDWVGEDEHGQLHWHAGVKTIGGGDVARGHAALDDMMKRVRNHTIDFLRNAPPPKK